MKDYISREAALVYAPLPKHLREYQTQNLDDAWEDGYVCALDQIRSIPAADVLPVILCKDCSSADYSGMGNGTVWCNEMEHAMQEDDFCSRGEKREES